MLVLSRKVTETIRVGDDVVITIVRIHGGGAGMAPCVKVGIEAPRDVDVDRGEIRERIERDGGRKTKPTEKGKP